MTSKEKRQIFAQIAALCEQVGVDPPPSAEDRRDPDSPCLRCVRGSRDCYLQGKGTSCGPCRSDKVKCSFGKEFRFGSDRRVLTIIFFFSDFGIFSEA